MTSTPTAVSPGRPTSRTSRALAWLRGAVHRGPRGSWLALALILGLLVNVVSLKLPLHADDHMQRAKILRHLAGETDERPWYEIFGLRNPVGEARTRTLIARGTDPWWTDLQQSGALWRPLSVLTHYVDYALWPRQPWLMHLQNLAWYALLIVAVARLYGALIPHPATGALALLFYALDDAHAETISWIAARNTLIGGVAAVCALQMHHGARLAGRRFGSLTAPLLLACALLSSEGAIAIWAYLLAYALWIDQGHTRDRAVALLPLAAVTACWQLTYRWLGFGVRGSGVYLDPIANPYEFLSALPVRLGGLWGEQFGVPIGLSFELAGAHTALQYASIALCAAITGVLVWWLRRERTLRFWFAGALLSLVPFCVFLPEPRLLILPSIGGFALLAELVLRAFRAGATQPRWLRALAGAVLVVHVALAAPLAVMRSQHQWRSEFWSLAIATTLPNNPEVVDKTFFILNSTNFLMASWSVLARMQYEPKPAGAFLFGTSLEPVRMTRVAPDAIVLEPEGGYLLEPTSTWVRSARKPFEPGFTAQVGPARVTVEGVTVDGRPARVRIEVPDMDSPRWIWLKMQVGFEPQALPAQGQTIVIVPKLLPPS